MNVTGWLKDEVTVASVTGTSTHGDPTFGAKRKVKCRLRIVRTTVTRPDGSETDSGHVIHTVTPIRLDDHVWLPGADTSNSDSAKTPLSVEASHDKSGSTTLYKVLL